MKSDKPNDRLPRDAVLARLLAEALDSKAAGDAQSAACPDAEVLAAYAEHGLSGQEASRWEGHLADCGRCQKIIAGVVVSSENLEDAGIRETGSLAPASVLRKPMRQPAAPGISRRPRVWHWWAPGIGLAAAVVLWFALHPGVRPEPASPRAAASAGTSQGSAQGNTAASSAKPEETQMAQANVPPPPAGISGAKLRDSEEPRANTPADALKKSPKQGSLQNERQTPMSPAASEVARAEASIETKEKDSGAPSARETDTKTQTTDALAETPTAGTAAAAPPTAESVPEAGSRQVLAPQLDRSARFSSSNQVRALAKAASPPIVFTSPDRSAFWRLGPAGLIENSSDQGKTWQQQTSGVTADLLAGAAPSPKIAWAVGKGGVILRTEDGEHWQRVMPPTMAQNVAPPDWIAVDARDELHATVASRDLHRYATADGGRSWVQQP